MLKHNINRGGFEVKTLVVKYTPRHKQSRTAELCSHFVDLIKPVSDIEILDLCKDLPDLLTTERLQSMILRNYEQAKISLHQQQLLHNMDRMCNQLLHCDALVLATPMYHNTMPAVVKAWFESVMLKGKTWDFTKTDTTQIFKPMIQNKQALVIVTSGSCYDEELEEFDHCAPLICNELEFMGFSPISTVQASGTDLPNETVSLIFESAKTMLAKIANQWS